MTPELWDKVCELFEKATVLPPTEHEAFFDSLKEAPPEVVRELRALLHEHDRDTFALLDDPIENLAAELTTESPTQAPPERIGPYRVVREIGRGGMGVVYLAQRDDGQFEQDVALKVVRHGMDSQEVRQRFVFERQVLAKLQHPGIANLLDGGIGEDGRPYFALEYIDGVALFDYCDAHSLSVDQRLRLFIRICDAVQYAHQSLIVHRDLKPSNILVTHGGEPRLLDFGIAKLLDVGALGDAAPLTRAGMSLLTPEYGAPEQLRGEPVTTAADVYALGVILYELLSGRRPYEFESHSPVAIYEAVVKTDPERPSTSVTHQMSRVAEQRSTTVMRLKRRLRGDLDVIALTAMAKEPSRRYPSAGELGQDLRRFLDERPIQARSDTLRYRVAKFTRRHTLAVAAVLLTLVSLIGGLGAAAWQGRIAAREAAKADAVSGFLLDMLSSANPDLAQGRDLSVRELVNVAATRLDDEQAVSDPQVEATIRATLGRTLRALGKYDEAVVQYEKALALSERSVTAQHPDALQIKSDLGAAHFDAGRLDEAQAYYRDVLDVSTRMLGAEHTITQQANVRLAGIHFRRGELEQAETILRQSVALRRRTLGADHADTLAAQSNLAVALAHQGRLADAAQLFTRTLEGLQKRHGEHDRVVILTKSNLANLYLELGDLDKTVALNEQSLASRRLTLDADHPELLESIGRMAGAYHEAGRFNEAQELFDEALPAMQTTLGADHLQTLTTRGNYALMQADQGLRDTALETLGRVTARMDEVLGTDHRISVAMRKEMQAIIDQN